MCDSLLHTCTFKILSSTSVLSLERVDTVSSMIYNTNRCSEDKTNYILILSWEFSSFINKEFNLTFKSILHPLYEDLKTDSDHMLQLSNPLPDNLIKENVLTRVCYHRQDLKGHSNSTPLRFGPMSIFTGASCFLKVGFSPFFDSLEQCFSAFFHYCTLRNLSSLFFFPWCSLPWHFNTTDISSTSLCAICRSVLLYIKRCFTFSS